MHRPVRNLVGARVEPDGDGDEAHADAEHGRRVEVEEELRAKPGIAQHEGVGGQPGEDRVQRACVCVLHAAGLHGVCSYA